MAPPARPKQAKKASTYVETPDYGSVFQDAEAARGQPNFRGKGVLSAETLKAIKKDDGNFTVSLWTMDRDGEPIRNRDGTRRFRLHIEPVWHDDDDSDSAPVASDNGSMAADEDDVPF